MNKQITRIAPSPTGMFHLGTARTAYFNYLMARATGGKFILRIDDTDKERNKQEYVDIILKAMDWLGLEYDEIQYQSKRMDIYLEAARKLTEAGKAFKATGVAPTILKWPIEAPKSFLDTIVGEIPITDTNIKQFNGEYGGLIILRSDGTPTYHFASIVDDYYMSINHIIRGVDHITNTPKQVAIWLWLDYVDVHNYSSFVGTYPKFSHLSLIFKDGKKLSKRDGACNLLEYKEQGYSPEAILNWMLLLGWSLKVPRGASKEKQKAANAPINKEQAIKLFLDGTMKNSNCNYDINKLNSLRRYYK